MFRRDSAFAKSDLMLGSFMLPNVDGKISWSHKSRGCTVEVFMNHFTRLDMLERLTRLELRSSTALANSAG